MRILVIGSGGREHAIVRALARDPQVDAIFAAPGNPGIGELAELHDVQQADPAAVTELAGRLAVDLVVIGPEAPLVAGVADVLRDNGFAVFGPSAAAARIEGSKAFAKAVMAASGVPTGRAVSVQPGQYAGDQLDLALAELGAPYVVKDDGLAAGKGVVVTGDRALAAAHGSAVLAAGHPVLVEEYLAGPEVSLFVVCDGRTGVPLLPAQDFKRAGDADTGPNTGGMGAYAPLPWAPADLVPTVMTTIVQPVLDELIRLGSPFVGLLYAGLVLTDSGPKVIEFNCRFGDPETQAVLELLASPLGELLGRAAGVAGHGGRGDLETAALQWKPGAAVTVVLAAENYPGTPVTGDEITGIPASGNQLDGDAAVLQAGTSTDGDGRLRSSGGRVLAAVGTGADVAAARNRAYRLIDAIHLRGAHHRTDIAAGI
ncbi:phosphoribosylamine--glycine ligase [Nakamurella aerolata]|uniref:Phosphoribosylamine--glycine ligase n=1 Tax=Nakamurella aerolata TaxID=1656892 RepID=A0A849A4Y6_9ACTN|nr:phosphoribosylamine--glycine ligase [Nakamurella aerolata]